VPDSAAERFQQHFASLPSELQIIVLELLSSREPYSLKCTRRMPQSFWYDMLIGGDHLPYLWDLDHKLVRECASEAARKNLILDWELLVRQLSQGCTYDWNLDNSRAHDWSTLTDTDMLRNRRRIWQLVEEMYVGDLLPTKRGPDAAGDPPAIPRYWDEEGEPLYPVVRMTGHTE
jgi:hypothetical protein